MKSETQAVCPNFLTTSNSEEKDTGSNWSKNVVLKQRAISEFVKVEIGEFGLGPKRPEVCDYY